MDLKRFWKYLSVSKKLYVVLGVTALLIALELFSLYFAMHTLSSVRSFVAGESNWSKSQKNAVIALHKFARTKDFIFYKSFEENLSVPLGDEQARRALEKTPPDIAAAYEGFTQGKFQKEDIPGVVSFFVTFRDVKYVSKAIGIWSQADLLTQEFIAESQVLKQLVQSKASEAEIAEVLERIDHLNDHLTVLEEEFSATLGEGSRWLEHMLLVSLVFATLLVGGVGLFLTVSFGRNLSKGLIELNEASRQVGQGYFGIQVPIRSGDELGQLAESLNRMASELHHSQGERRQAEQASQLKSLFLANMSHEIRTPLAAIIGFSDLLKEPNLSEAERIQFLDIIQRTGENLTRIINDILDLSKVEAGHLAIEKVACSLAPLLDDIHMMMETRCNGKALQVEFTRRGVVPDVIYCDPIRVRQILINIIGNAVKFTEKGQVRMTYEVSGSHLVFTVTDTGIGIAPDKKELLFHAFSQVDSSTSRKFDGTGLGLLLSRRLSQLMGGDIYLADSEYGKGCTFVVKIGLESVEKTLPAPIISKGKLFMSAEILANKSILVIDDVEDNRLLIQRMLGRRGARLALAANGQEGLNKALEGDFDIILMDIQMPVMDGYTATKRLREAGYKKPIIALTAHAMKEDRDRCLDVGCTDYLIKPVQLEKLVQTILNYSELKVLS